MKMSEARFKLHNDAAFVTFGNDVYLGFKFSDRAPTVLSISIAEYEALRALDKNVEARKFYDSHALLPHLLTFEEFRHKLDETYRGLVSFGLLAKTRDSFKPKSISQKTPDLGTFSWYQLIKKGCVESPFFFKIPLFSPDAFLTRLYPVMQGLFSPSTIVTALCVSALIIASFFSRTYELTMTQGIYAEFLNTTNVLLMLCILIISKIPHELGHALAMKHLGYKVHEMGMACMIFTPCLYCDVDELYFEPSKWKRFLVYSAGIYIDILVTALAALLYMSVDENSALSHLSKLTVYANIGYTMVINLIPFTRFDGHYMLASIWERQNLGDDAKAYFTKWIRYILGRDESWVNKESLSSDQYYLWGFALLSLIYKAVLTIGILMYMYALGATYDCGFMSAIIAGSLLFRGGLKRLF